MVKRFKGVHRFSGGKENQTWHVKIADLSSLERAEIAKQAVGRRSEEGGGCKQW